jgi:hypothetical protein
MRLKLVSLAILLVCASSLADNAAHAETQLSQEFETPHFVVRYDPSDPYLARIMAHGAEEHLGRIAHSLGLKLEPNRRFHLYVYPTHIGFIKAGGLQERKFTVGTAQSNEIISIDASGVFETADRIMAHEITHAVIFRILGRQAVRLPLWLNEGLAEYESQDYPDKAQARAADAAADSLLIPLSDLSEAFPERQTDLAYSESFLAAKYLVDEFGKSAPRRLLAELARRGSFDEAARNTIGIGGAEFQDRWYEATTSRYRTLALTRIAAAVGSVVMACLAIVAFLVRRKQKIEAARRWEQEEFEDYLRRQLNDDWHR